MPWEDPQFYWLEDPHESVPAMEYYVFSRDLTFPRPKVLNHRVLEGGRIPGYGVLAGLLLGRSFGCIPASVHHGTEVQAVMHVIDHAGTDHVLEFSLYVDRSNAIQRAKQSKRTAGGPYGPGESPGDAQNPGEEGTPIDSTDSKQGVLVTASGECRAE